MVNIALRFFYVYVKSGLFPLFWTFTNES